MNTHVRNLGKRLEKEKLKKIKGGTEEGGNGLNGLGGLGCKQGCECCTAYPLYGTGTTHSICDDSDALLTAWENVWTNFGYRVECKAVKFI